MFGIGGLGYHNMTKIEISGTLQPTSNTVVIFDFDGVICDSFHQFVEVFNDLTPYYNLTKLNNKDNYAKFNTEDVLKEHGVSAWKLPFVATHMRRNLKAHLLTMQTFPGIKESIEEMVSEGIVVGILTSNSEELVSKFLQAHGLTDFQFIYSGSSVFGKAKSLKEISKRLGTTDIFYIGDEVRDIKAADEANVKSIAVTWGFHSKELLESAQPDAIALAPNELLSLIRKGQL